MNNAEKVLKEAKERFNFEKFMKIKVYYPKQYKEVYNYLKIKYPNLKLNLFSEYLHHYWFNSPDDVSTPKCQCGDYLGWRKGNYKNFCGKKECKYVMIRIKNENDLDKKGIEYILKEYKKMSKTADVFKCRISKNYENRKDDFLQFLQLKYIEIKSDNLTEYLHHYFTDQPYNYSSPKCPICGENRFFKFNYYIDTCGDISCVKAKMIRTKQKIGIVSKFDELSRDEQYRILVWNETWKSISEHADDAWGENWSEKRGRNKFHINHRVSIVYGYNNLINPKIIGSFENLQFIESRKNVRKGAKCDISLEELLSKINDPTIELHIDENLLNEDPFYSRPIEELINDFVITHLKMEKRLFKSSFTKTFRKRKDDVLNYFKNMFPNYDGNYQDYLNLWYYQYPTDYRNETCPVCGKHKKLFRKTCCNPKCVSRFPYLPKTTEMTFE